MSLRMAVAHAAGHLSLRPEMARAARRRGTFRMLQNTGCRQLACCREAGQPVNVSLRLPGRSILHRLATENSPPVGGSIALIEHFRYLRSEKIGTSMVSRRDFLQSSVAVAVGFVGLRSACHLEAADSKSRQAVGYGPLKTDPQKLLDLPEGFSYRIISRRGAEMADGLLVPGAPDGMATFEGPDGLTLIVRNHEVTPDRSGPWGRGAERFSKVDASRVYDAGEGKTPACGGTTTIVYNTRTGETVREFLSLAGTTRNCAGGPTPWGSWVTCEETVYSAGIDRKKKYVAEREHGYCFDVPATAEPSLADPVPLKAMGRFNHEAIAIDAASGAVYLTEDRNDSCLYRFLPTTPGKLAEGGRLQALALASLESADTRNWSKGKPAIVEGQQQAVRWIDLDEVEAPKDDLRYRAFEAGAARFARGEGMWTGEDGIYFACTSGGRAHAGQIFRYVPSADEGTDAESGKPGTLELFVEPNDVELVKNADNLTVAPWGDLVVCEDRSDPVVRLVGVTPAGKLYTLGNTPTRGEFAGATFSPDGTTLFVNLQSRGLTLAITGPWDDRVG